MSTVNDQVLLAYLEDALNESQTAWIEKTLRESEPLRKRLRGLMQISDQGEHSVGAIWRRHRLSCPTREQLGSYLLGGMDDDHSDYVRFHLETVACAFCNANVADLKTQHLEATPHVKERRKRYFQTSVGSLQPNEPKKGK